VDSEDAEGMNTQDEKADAEQNIAHKKATILFIFIACSPYQKTFLYYTI
jgi:hypothetical protein